MSIMLAFFSEPREQACTSLVKGWLYRHVRVFRDRFDWTCPQPTKPDMSYLDALSLKLPLLSDTLSNVCRH